jgi:hypothetical protein
MASRLQGFARGIIVRRKLLLGLLPEPEAVFPSVGSAARAADPATDSWYHTYRYGALSTVHVILDLVSPPPPTLPPVSSMFDGGVLLLFPRLAPFSGGFQQDYASWSSPDGMTWFQGGVAGALPDAGGAGTMGAGDGGPRRPIAIITADAAEDSDFPVVPMREVGYAHPSHLLHKSMGNKCRWPVFTWSASSSGLVCKRAQIAVSRPPQAPLGSAAILCSHDCLCVWLPFLWVPSCVADPHDDPWRE